MSESTFEKIMRRTGRKPSFCKCVKCKSQCSTPCLGTPEDIQKLVDAGFKDRLKATTWAAGIIMELIDEPINMVQATYDEEKKACTFFNNGLCELHDLGLKPTEGKLSYHTITKENYTPQKALSWNVAKEWIGFFDKK